MDAPEILTELTTLHGRNDPYPLYAKLHEIGQVIPVDDELIVVGYDLINDVLRDPGYKVTDRSSFERSFRHWRDHPIYVQGADWILNLNAPRHSQVRSLIARAFTARRIAGLEPAIASMADELIATMAEAGSGSSPVEFMHDFAFLLPVTVICELIGIPRADREWFRPLADDVARIFEDTKREELPRIDAAAVTMLDYFGGLAASRRASPRDDLLSDLLAIADAGDGRLTDAELLHNLTLLLVAGFETTTNLLGNGMWIILTDQQAREAVTEDSVSPAAFVDEVLRFDSPVQLTSRIGHQTELGGVAVTDQTSVTVVLGAGNRDHRRFTHPDLFDPARHDGGPLSFGGGPHFCIGAALARLEGSVAFPRLLRRFPKIASAGAPLRRNTLVLRGFEELPVTLN